MSEEDGQQPSYQQSLPQQGRKVQQNVSNQGEFGKHIFGRQVRVWPAILSETLIDTVTDFLTATDVGRLQHELGSF